MPVTATFDDYGSGLSQDDLHDVFQQLDLFRLNRLDNKEDTTIIHDEADKSLSSEVERWQREQQAREEDMMQWEREMDLWELQQHEYLNDLERD